MRKINWDDFEQVELRAGTVVQAEEYVGAKKPALKLLVDFGPDIGLRKSSAQISTHYKPEELIGRQVIGVVNFPPKQIGRFMSEFLCTGFADANGAIVLAQPERPVPNGARLC